MPRPHLTNADAVDWRIRSRSGIVFSRRHGNGVSTAAVTEPSARGFTSGQREVVRSRRDHMKPHRSAPLASSAELPAERRPRSLLTASASSSTRFRSLFAKKRGRHRDQPMASVGRHAPRRRGRRSGAWTEDTPATVRSNAGTAAWAISQGGSRVRDRQLPQRRHGRGARRRAATAAPRRACSVGRAWRSRCNHQEPAASRHAACRQGPNISSASDRGSSGGNRTQVSAGKEKVTRASQEVRRGIKGSCVKRQK